ncbi:MAG: hypothetical protein CUN52_08755 [Phototrophicales bacterium]|nr:MAG: hypothetical protein CUN52_08755 [Phototrophicales bacterium]
MVSVLLEQFLQQSLDLLNETLAAAIVVVAASLLLYNLSRNLRNRVTRTSSAVLACVTIVYVGDVLMALAMQPATIEALLRFQWIGLAFIPASTFHLSDALLATTGLPSRGRRKRVVRILYALATALLVLAALTDLLVNFVRLPDGRVSLNAGMFFGLYMAYLIPTSLIALANVWRARARCITKSTQRRMTYLLLSVLMPTIGIFPYSVFLPIGEEFTASALFLVNITNIVVILALLFLAYPLSFFGSDLPDRVVKADLLRFMLLGPATGLLALVAIIYNAPFSRLLGGLGQEFMPFIVVLVILVWQWTVDVILPHLEKRLIYYDDTEQVSQLRNLNERLFTRADLLQLLEANLEATCDYMQVNGAFIIKIANHMPELINTAGHIHLTETMLKAPDFPLDSLLPDMRVRWGDYWLVGLYSHRHGKDESVSEVLIGCMGFVATSSELTVDEEKLLSRFVRRLTNALDDLLLQDELYAALEGLLPQINVTRARVAEVDYLPGRDAKPRIINGNIPSRDELIEQVHAALRHYWGGPGLTSSRLLELYTVKQALPENDNNPVRALRAVLLSAIEKLKPEGERSMKNPEWTLYNILQLRFLEQRKVRDTATRLYMSDANLYRKQNVAIEAVVDVLMDMEREASSIPFS